MRYLCSEQVCIPSQAYYVEACLFCELGRRAAEARFETQSSHSTCLSLAAQCPRACRAAETRHNSSRTVEQPRTFTCYRKTVVDSRPAAHGHLRTTALPLEPHLRAAAREPAAAAPPRRRRRPPGGAGRPGAAVRDRAAVRALRARRGLRGLRRPGAVRGDHARDAAVAAAPRRVAVAVDEPAAGRSTRLIKLYLLRRSSRRRAASLADMGRTSSLLGRAHVVTSVTWLK